MIVNLVALATALLSTATLGHATASPDSLFHDSNSLVTRTVSSLGRNATFDPSTGILSWDGPLSSSPLETRGQPFSAGFGLMIERDLGEVEKRGWEDRGVRTRDMGRIEVDLDLDERGVIEGLEEHLNRFPKRSRKSKKQKAKAKKAAAKKKA